MAAPLPKTAALSRPDRQDILIAAGFALAGLLLFLWRIGDPAKLNFDETHYVPAARTLIDMAALPNAEHPPLGKLLIGLGMTLFGDNPFGWRVMSALAGSALLFGGVMAARWLFLRRPTAIMAGALMLFSPTLLVQARIAMLDIFMAAFLMLALWQFAAAWRTGFALRRHFVLAALFSGLAVGSKWTAVPILLVVVPLTLWLVWQAHKQAAKADHIKAAITAKALPLRDAAGWLIGLSALVYLATFLPYLFLRHDALSIAGIVPQQFRMLSMQGWAMGPHPYQSVWWQWVLNLRPVWYFYEPVAGVQRGVLLVGNPVICWGGLIALPVALWAAFRQQARPMLVPVLLWATPLVFFIVAPKPVQFYYHYFLSSLMLCIASAAVLDHYFYRHGKRLVPWLAIGAAGLVFLEFYPIVSASALGDAQDFNRWMWLASWR